MHHRHESTTESACLDHVATYMKNFSSLLHDLFMKSSCSRNMVQINQGPGNGAESYLVRTIVQPTHIAAASPADLAINA